MYVCVNASFSCRELSEPCTTELPEGNKIVLACAHLLLLVMQEMSACQLHVGSILTPLHGTDVSACTKLLLDVLGA